MYDSLTDATLNLTLTRENPYMGFALEFNIDNDSIQYYVYKDGSNHIYSTWNFIVDFNNGFEQNLHTNLGHKINAWSFLNPDIGMMDYTYYISQL